MRISVDSLQRYKRQLKRLEKKYRTALGQSALLTEEIKRGEHPGDATPGFDGVVYNARRNNRAVPGGECKGYLFVYCIHPPDQATMISVYAKTEQQNISDSEIAELLKDVEKIDFPVNKSACANLGSVQPFSSASVDNLISQFRTHNSRFSHAPP